MHDFETQRWIDPTFVSAPGFGFVVQGAEGVQDLPRVGAGIKLNITKQVSFNANVSTDLYQTPSYMGWAGFNYAW